MNDTIRKLKEIEMHLRGADVRIGERHLKRLRLAIEQLEFHGLPTCFPIGERITGPAWWKFWRWYWFGLNPWWYRKLREKWTVDGEQEMESFEAVDPRDKIFVMDPPETPWLRRKRLLMKGVCPDCETELRTAGNRYGMSELGSVKCYCPKCDSLKGVDNKSK